MQEFPPGEVDYMLNQYRAKGSPLPDAVKTVLHAAYFFDMPKIFEDAPDYLQVFRAPRNLTEKAMVYTMVNALLEANQPQEGKKTNRKEDFFIKVLNARLIENHYCIDRLVHEVPDHTSISPETFDIFLGYAKQSGFGQVMPDYETRLKGMDKGEFVSALALKFFYDSMTVARKKKSGSIKRPIRKIDRQVDSVLQASFASLGLNKKNYLDNIKGLLEADDMTFMNSRVHSRFKPFIPQDL